MPSFWEGSTAPAPLKGSLRGAGFFDQPIASDTLRPPPILPGFTSAPAETTGPTPTMAQPAKRVEPGVGSLSAYKPSLGEQLWDGATGPFRGSWHAARALLMDPSVRVLPLAGPMASSIEPEASPRLQEGEMEEAQRLGMEGAKFYGSWAAAEATGGILNPTTAGALRGALMLGAGGGSWKALDDLPDVVKGKVSPADFVSHIGQAAGWSAALGGALGGAPWLIGRTAPAAKAAASVADRILSKVPGYEDAKQRASAFIAKSFVNTWDKFWTSGESLLENHGMADLAQQMRVARSSIAFMAGRHVADFRRTIDGLDDHDIRQISWLMENMDLSKDPPGELAGWLKTDSKDLWGRGRKISGQLREIGESLQKAGVQVFDPTTGTHTFALRDNYVPHRFVNPDAFREGGEYRDAAVKQIMDRLVYTKEAAEDWLDKFSDRLNDQLTGASADPGRINLGTGAYAKARALGLPGYETDLRITLPQYFEHASRRYINHVMFGDTHEVQSALRPAIQMGLFPEGELPYKAPDGVAQAIQPQLSQLERFPGGKGIPAETEPIRPLTPEQFARKEIALAMKQARRDLGIVTRYPRAFEGLANIESPEAKKLIGGVIRRQLGSLDQPLFGGKFLQKMAQYEVVTKLALGAIAQPSQILSGIVRTEWRGALGNLWKTIKDDPDALDMALRAGVTIPSVIRQSELSLTQGSEDFLHRVFFTQWDEKSRVFGVLQGQSFASHVADQLASLVKKGEALARAGKPTGRIDRRLTLLSSKLSDLGIKPSEAVAQGGALSSAQLLKAGQKVSSDVNFWGDALSLPEFYKSPYGRFLTQFKSFAFQQWRVMRRYVVKPAVDAIQGRPGGDLGPLIRMAVTMPAGGELITDLKKAIRQKQRTGTAWDRVFENISQAAGFGILWDFLESSNYQLGGTLGFASGPIGSELGKFGMNVSQAALGKPRGLAKQAIEFALPAAAFELNPRLAPLAATVAPAISNRLLPPQPTRQ